ncbi:MAG: methyltransferase domain-containing protein [Christensenellales bacterium]|jgi:ubiquinone/menaquinone biosynthesis C-methylase UbiE
MKSHMEKIREEFTKQAESFDQYQKSFSREEHSRFVINNMALLKSDIVLEVAAGTCAFGREIAPHVKEIVELDSTEAMLEVGRREGEKAGISNAVYVNGLAEELPFAGGSFDVVVSRLAFHHFEDAKAPFSEMHRVLKEGGRLAVVDMEAREESLRKTADSLERLRDPSHVRCLAREEFTDMARRHGMQMEHCEMIRVPVKLADWLELTKTPEATRRFITAAMEDEICGGEKTGFEPYAREGDIYFDHLWLQIIARKQSE